MAEKVKVKMTSYMTLKGGVAYKPGDIVEFDAKEAARVVSVGGAVPHEEESESEQKGEN